MYGAGLPEVVTTELLEAYRALRASEGEDVGLAVRSSATAEDLPTASFAGQQETVLNVTGHEDLLDSVRFCYTSLFTDRAIVYRARHGFDEADVSLSVTIPKLGWSGRAAPRARRMRMGAVRLRMALRRRERGDAVVMGVAPGVGGHSAYRD